MADAAIRVEGLKKSFGTLAALDGVDFEVTPATVFGLLGPNGAGKTTAVRVLATILQPDGGRAEVLGYDVVRQPEQVRYRIGLAGQFAAVDANLTGRENLRLVGRLGQLPRARHRSARGRAARAIRLGRRRRPAGQDVLGRHAPPAGRRRVADAATAGAVLRRAHDRARPAEPRGAVGHDPRAGERRDDRPADHAVPGGGRPPGRPDRRRGRRKGDRERYAGEPEVAVGEHGDRGRDAGRGAGAAGGGRCCRR